MATVNGMPATYTGSPATRPIDEVRLLCRDHVEGRMRLTDAEVEYLIAQEANAYMAAAAACELMVERLVKSKTVGDLSIDYNVDGMRQRAAELRRRGQVGAPIAAGLPAINGDLSGRYFRRGMHENR